MMFDDEKRECFQCKKANDLCLFEINSYDDTDWGKEELKTHTRSWREMMELAKHKKAEGGKVIFWSDFGVVLDENGNKTGENLNTLAQSYMGRPTRL